MKILITIGIVQLVLLVYICLNISSLPRIYSSSEIDQDATHSKQIAASVSANETKMLAPNEFSLDQLRGVIQEELAASNNNTQYKTAAPSPTLEPLKQTEAERFSYQQRYQEIESQIDYALSDGDFSRIEQISMERNMAKLNPEDQKLMLNKLSKAMTKNDIQMAY